MAGLGAKGRLYVTVLECKELANKELLGKMDPNLEGKEDLFHANVYDHETLGFDDHVGRCDLSLDKLDITDKPHWYDLRDKNNFTKIAGYLCLTCKFEGTGWPNQTFVSPTPAPAPAPAPAATPATASAPVQQQQQPVMYQPSPQYSPQAQHAQFSPVYAQQAHGHTHTHSGSFVFTQAAPGQPVPIMYAQQPQQPQQQQQPQMMYAQQAQQPQMVYAQQQPQQQQPQLVYATQPGQPMMYAPQQPQYR